MTRLHASHPGFDAFRSKLTHSRVKLDGKPGMLPPLFGFRSLADSRPDHGKTHLYEPLLHRIDKVHADMAVTHPADLGRHPAAVGQMQCDLFADTRHGVEDHHGAGSGEIDDPYCVLSSTQFEAGRLRADRRKRAAEARGRTPRGIIEPLSITNPLTIA